MWFDDRSIHSSKTIIKSKKEGKNTITPLQKHSEKVFEKNIYNKTNNNMEPTVRRRSSSKELKDSKFIMVKEKKSANKNQTSSIQDDELTHLLTKMQLNYSYTSQNRQCHEFLMENRRSKSLRQREDTNNYFQLKKLFEVQESNNSQSFTLPEKELVTHCQNESNEKLVPYHSKSDKHGHVMRNCLKKWQKRSKMCFLKSPKIQDIIEERDEEIGDVTNLKLSTSSSPEFEQIFCEMAIPSSLPTPET